MHLVGCLLICTVHVYKSYFISNSFDCHFQFFGKEINISLLLDELDLSLYKVLYFCNVNFLLQGAVSVSHPNRGHVNRVFIYYNTEGDSQLIIPDKLILQGVTVGADI